MVVFTGKKFIIFVEREKSYVGGKASGFNNVHDRDEYDEDGVRMFRVRCASGESDARATQVRKLVIITN